MSKTVLHGDGDREDKLVDSCLAFIHHQVQQNLLPSGSPGWGCNVSILKY